MTLDLDLPFYGLTLWQPMASAIPLLGKRVENRPWAPPRSILGQRIAIHAAAVSKRDGFKLPIPVPARYQDLFVRYADGSWGRRGTPGLALGAVVAVARVVGALDKRPTQHTNTQTWLEPQRIVIARDDATEAERAKLRKLDQDTWWLGPCGWLLSDVRPMRTPIPAKGAQRLWRLSTDLRVAIARELEAA